MYNNQGFKDTTEILMLRDVNIWEIHDFLSLDKNTPSKKRTEDSYMKKFDYEVPAVDDKKR